MRRLSAFFAVLSRSLSAPIATVAALAVSFPPANETVNQHTSFSALPSDPIPNLSSPPCSVSSNLVALQLPNANYSLSPSENLTAGLHFHIPDTPIELKFTSLGHPLGFETVFETLELAIGQISIDVGLHPAESITNGFFRQRNDGVETKVCEYIDKQVTWSLLNQLLVGMRYFISQLRRSCELRFEIYIVDEGLVGHGSVWYTGLEGKDDVAKRAVSETSQQLPPIMSIVSKPAPTNSNDYSSPLALPTEDDIIFSYHFFGPAIPESLLELCFRRARQSIHANVQHHPQDGIPNGFFQYRADGSSVSIEVKAYFGKRISWLLLYHILGDIGSSLIGGHHLLPCSFEFEIYPFEEAHGHGSLLYDAAAILPANASRIAASAVKRAFPRLLRCANDTFNSLPNAIDPTPDAAISWVVVPISGTPISLFVEISGEALPLWDVASTLGGARNEVFSHHATHADMPITDSHLQCQFAGSSVWVMITAEWGKTVTWQDLNDALKGLLDHLCTRREASRRRLRVEILRDRRDVVGSGIVFGTRPTGGMWLMRDWEAVVPPSHLEGF